MLKMGRGIKVVGTSRQNLQKNETEISKMNVCDVCTRPDGQHVCNRCSAVIESDAAMVQHLAHRPSTCGELLREYGDVAHINMFRAQLTPSSRRRRKTFACRECGVEFEEARELAKHHFLDHSDTVGSVWCDECSLPLSRKNAGRHNLRHTNRRLHVPQETPNKRMRVVGPVAFDDAIDNAAPIELPVQQFDGLGEAEFVDARVPEHNDYAAVPVLAGDNNDDDGVAADVDVQEQEDIDADAVDEAAFDAGVLQQAAAANAPAHVLAAADMPLVQYVVPVVVPNVFNALAVTSVNADDLFGVPRADDDGGAPRLRGRPRGSHYARSENVQLKENTMKFLAISQACHLSDATADKLLGFIASIGVDLVPSLAAARSMASELVYVPPVSKTQVRCNRGIGDKLIDLAYTDPLAHLAALVADEQVTIASQPSADELASGTRTLRALQGVDAAGVARDRVDSALLRSLPLPSSVRSSAATAFLHERFAQFKSEGALVVGVEVHFDDAAATRGTKCTFVRVRFVGAREPRQWLEVAAFPPDVISVNTALRLVVLPLIEQLQKGIRFVDNDGATNVLVCGDVQAIICDKVAHWDAMNMKHFQPTQVAVARVSEDWWRSMCNANGVGAVTSFQSAIKWRSLSGHERLLLDANVAIATGASASVVKAATKRYRGAGLKVVNGCAANESDAAVAVKRANDHSLPADERRVQRAFADKNTLLLEVPFILHPCLRAAASVGSLIAPPDPMHSLDEGEMRRIVELFLATVEPLHIDLMNQLLCRIPKRPIGSRLENHARKAFCVVGSDDDYDSHKICPMTCKQFIAVVHALPPVLADAGYKSLGHVLSLYLEFYDVAMRGAARNATWGDLRDARKRASDEFISAVDEYRLPVTKALEHIREMSRDEARIAVWRHLCFAAKTVDLNHATFAMWHGNASDIDTESAEAALKSAMFVVKHQSALRTQLAAVSVQKQASWHSATRGMLDDALSRERDRAFAGGDAVRLANASVAAEPWQLELLRNLRPSEDASRAKLSPALRVEARGVGRRLKFRDHFAMVVIVLDDDTEYCGNVVMAGENDGEAFVVLLEYELVKVEARSDAEVDAAKCGCLAMAGKAEENDSFVIVALATIASLRELVVTVQDEHTLTLPVRLGRAIEPPTSRKVYWHKHLSHY